jgi:hypothetical protein
MLNLVRYFANKIKKKGIKVTKKSILFLVTLIPFFTFGSTNFYSYLDINAVPTGITFKPGTQLTSDEFGKTYFIANDGRICYYWWTGTSWQCEALSIQAASQRSMQYSGLEYKNNSLFFVNENGDVSRFFYDNNVWTPQVLNSTSPKAMVASQLTVDEFGKVYYVATDGRVCYSCWTGTYWRCAPLSASIPSQRSKQNTGLEYRNNTVFFVNENGDIACFNYIGGVWSTLVLNPSAPKAMVGSQLTTDENGKIYYVAQDGTICIIYNFNSQWAYSWLGENIPKAQAWTSIYYNLGQLFFVGLDRKAYVAYYNDCKWEYSNLNNNAIVAQNSDLSMTSNAAFSNNLFYVNNADNRLHILQPTIPRNNSFIFIKGKKFMKNNASMDVKVMNYSLDINTDDCINFWISPNLSYDTKSSERDCGNRDLCKTMLNQHFMNLKKQGFTALRIVGLDVKPQATLDLGISVVTSNPAYSYTSMVLSQSLETKLFALIQDVLMIAESNGLNVILLTGAGGNQSTSYHSIYGSYLSRLANNIKNNPTLMAYDIYNEPGTNTLIQDKDTICNATRNWYNSIKSNDPNHLVTIGNGSIQDVLNWDPGILSVDFLSFHLYPLPKSSDTEPIMDPRNRVFNSIKWISNAGNMLNKPWIIGETGFAADLDNSLETNTDWGTEQDQDNYVRATIERTLNCGGSGYSWWQYHDVYWGSPSQNFLGLYSHNNTAKKIISNQTFLKFQQVKQCDCPQPPSYYDSFDIPKYTYTGIINGDSGVVKDAVIYGWGEKWSGGTMTLSKSDGTFILGSSIPLYYIRASYINKSIEEKSNSPSSPIAFNVGPIVLIDLSCSSSSLK